MTSSRRILVGLVVRLAVMGCLALLILEPEKRARVLPLMLGIGTAAYLTGEWIRGRRATRRHELDGKEYR